MCKIECYTYVINCQICYNLNMVFITGRAIKLPIEVGYQNMGLNLFMRCKKLSMKRVKKTNSINAQT